MAFPEDLVLVTVTGTILHPADGSPATGGVMFAIPQPLTDTEGHVIVGNTPITATLVNGSFSVRLPATDQAQVRPVGWVYTITVSTDAGGMTFQAGLPSTPTSVTLDDLIPVVTPPAVGVYVPLSEVGQPGGVASLDGTGKVPAAQLPTGTAAVQSVTAADSTITIGGTSTAPTVAVNAIAESKVTGLTTDLAAKYVKPGSGIPASDMATSVQTSLGLANTSVQSLAAADGTVVVGGTATAPTVRVGTVTEPQVTGLAADLAGKTPTSRQILAGTGLSGGGDLTADRTLTIAYGTTAGTAAQGNDPRIVGAVQQITASGDTTGATDTAAINTALATGGRVILTGAFWINAPLIAHSNTWLQGSAYGGTSITLLAGSNCDVIQGNGFASLTMTGTPPFAGGVSSFVLSDVLLDGNATNQTSPSYGYRVYGYANAVRNVVIRNCLTGIWHECGPLSAQDGPTDPGSECEFSNIRIYLSRSHGMMLLGPSDCVVSDVTIGFSNAAASAVGVGFWAMCDQRSNIMSTASAMNGISAAGFTGTFTVAAAAFGGATDFYASSGTLAVQTSTGTAVMTYTGKTATTFTGCVVSSGSGTFVTGNQVVTSGAQRFTTNGLALSQVHPFGCSQSWAFVLDGTATAVNCHSDGTNIGGVLARSAMSWHGGEIYDFTPTTVSCAVQLGDAGATSGVPLTAVLPTSQCDIVTSVAGFQLDQASRAAVLWANASQSRASIKAITQTTGTHSTTLASGSNGADLSTFTSGSPGTLFVASTANIPTTGGGTLTVATAKGTVTCTYTGTNAAAVTPTSRPAGNQFTGVIATGTSGSGYTMSTGGTVAQALQGTVGVGGTVDSTSRVDVHVSSSALASSTAASQEYGLGAYSRDLGSAANAFRLRSGGVDQLNLNTSTKQLQLPNGQQVLLYSDNYATKTLTLDGSLGLITGPTRGGKAMTFPGPLWVPGDHGLITATGDPALAAANSTVTGAGTVYHCRVHCPVVFTATNVVIYVVTAGSGLTAGQCFAGLYGPSGSLIASTADLSSGATSFASAGSYTFPLAGGPYTNLATGDYTVAFFYNGTTGPALARFGNVASGLANLGLSSGTYRHFTADTGRTTSLPATIGTPSSNGIAWFAGIS